MIDYFLEAIRIGIPISRAYEYEKLQKERDRAIKEYNRAVLDENEELKEKYGNIILKCQAKTQKLIYRG